MLMKQNCPIGGVGSLGFVLLVSAAVCVGGQSEAVPRVYGQAQQAMNKGDYATAIKDYSNLTRVNDHSAPLFFQLGMAQYQSGDYESAIRSLRVSVSLDHELAAAKAFLGLSEAAADHLELAIPSLREAFAVEDRLDPEVYRIVGQRLGRAYSASGQQGAAEAVFSRLLARYPDDPDVLYESFWFHLSTARTLMSRILQKAPDSYRTHQMLGYLLMQRQSYSAAAQQFRKALEENPEALGLHYEMGNLLLMTHADGKAASHEFNEELRLHPTHAPSYYRLGELAFQDRNYAEAERLYQLTLKNDPRYVNALVGLAKISLAQEDRKRAEEYAKKAVRVDPSNRFGHYVLSRLYRLSGHEAEAAAEIAKFDRLAKQASEESQFLASVETGGASLP